MTAPPTSEAVGTRDIDRVLGRQVGPALADLAARLRSETALSGAEREAVLTGAATTLREAVWQRVDRVVVLEMQGARLTGRLSAPDPRGRWEKWVAGLERPGGWEALAAPYPPLLPRLHRLIDNRCAAVLDLARRYDRDRDDLASLLGTAPGSLREATFGAGDSHQGGRSVAMLRCEAGPLVYKPRPLAADAALAELLPRLLPDEPEATRIRVPAVLSRRDHRGDYGWAAHVAHRYCDGDEELRAFYRGLGHWLAVMRMLGGSDLHFQNLVAAGPVPVVVDCETLFTPHRRAAASGYGEAVDLAFNRVHRSALRIGLLPGRGVALGARGADWSAAASLPGQQPAVEVSTIVDLGTDQARVGTVHAVPRPGQNRPSRHPDLSDHWPHVVEGFLELDRELRARDRAGRLAPLLASFADCPVRVVVRDTVAYEALERMLWHPSSLHRPEPAAARAADLLARHARNAPAAPDDPAVIGAEVADLLVGDVPVFVTTAASGVLTGPGGLTWGEPQDLVSAALDSWRTACPEVDRQVVEASLISAYLDADLVTGRRRVPVDRVRGHDLDRRRRAQTAAIMTRLAKAAIHGDDGTVTWVAPGLDSTGWSVRPLSVDLYDGLAGVAVLLAAYQREVTAGRADELPDLDPLAAAAVRTLRFADDQQERDRARAAEAGIRVRPDPPGGYLGLGSRLWAWLLLQDLGAIGAAEAVRRAQALAGLLPEAVEEDEGGDLLGGAAGAVVVLLRLAERTGSAKWRELACRIGRRLADRAVRSDGSAYWRTRLHPDGIGGLSHGVTGFGWALGRLAAATGDAVPAELAAAAFARDETYYDPEVAHWRDSRIPGGFAVAWCHGSVGVGVAAADLLATGGYGHADDLRERLDRAARATWPGGLGSTHTLCHGDMSAWELLDLARRAGVGPGLDRDQVTARILTSLEDHRPATGLIQDVFTPALMSGLGGTAYQLLRMHPDSRLPSVLLPDPGPPPR
jgi:type 2 lantibiotic biosynthesis protein LanM